MQTDLVQNKEEDIEALKKFFDAASTLFSELEQQFNLGTKYYLRLGDHTLLLKFANSELVPFLIPAMSHLLIQPVTDPDLTLCLWDSESTHSQMFSPPFTFDKQCKRGEIKGFNDERFHTSYVDDALNLLDRKKKLGLFWTRSTKNIPYWVKGAPLRTLLCHWLIDKGIQLVHGAAIGHPKGGVLLAGRGGSGKSTLALNCINTDLNYISDDYLLLDSNKPTVYSLYNSGKKNADDVSRFPQLLKSVSNKDKLDSEKALYFLNDICPEKVLKTMPLVALLVPKIISGSKSYLEPITLHKALAALIPSTVKQLAGADDLTCILIEKGVSNLPCFQIYVGNDLTHAHQIINELITQRIKDGQIIN